MALYSFDEKWSNILNSSIDMEKKTVTPSQTTSPDGVDESVTLPNKSSGQLKEELSLSEEDTLQYDTRIEEPDDEIETLKVQNNDKDKKPDSDPIVQNNHQAKELFNAPLVQKKQPNSNTEQDSNNSKRKIHTERRTTKSRKWIETALENGLPSELIKAGLLDKRVVVEFLKTVYEGEQSFFSVLVAAITKNELSEIFQWIKSRNHWELIEDEKTLEEQLISKKWLTYDKALEQNVAALKSDNENVFRYCAIDPFDVVVRDWVERCSKLESEVVLVHPEIFPSVLRRKKIEASNKDKLVEKCIEFTEEEINQIRDNTDSCEIPKMVNYFLYQAYIKKASDIHIEPTEKTMILRYRLDGILHTDMTLPITFHAEAISRLKIMSGMDIAEKRRPQDGRMSKNILNNIVDIRVSSFPTEFGEKFVLRLLDSSALAPSLDKLKMSEKDLDKLKEKITAPLGLIMISGPTGSGKTTTLYSCLGNMDKKEKNVLTIEDPVEYHMPGVHQMKVNPKIGLTFATGLRTILRQDPDVIMVGEIRDEDTASMAVQAALTGHIVFSTIHTNDSTGVITRLIDMKVEPFLIASSLTMAIAQRLLRKNCPHCSNTPKSGHKVKEDLLKVEGMNDERITKLNIKEDNFYYEGAGCDQCNNTGFIGRQAVFEVFEMTEKARELILATNSLSNEKLKNSARESHMGTLLSHGLELVDNRVTTFKEVVRVLGEEV
ncbi:MAG: type II/IV secretion system protein [Magnetococcales bacterium]|nr:type II/IV secretion system protein [Magnetococcales bacterium]